MAQRNARRRLERERGHREATADMSEDLSDGEKGDTVGDMSTHGDNISVHGDSVRGKLPRISSVDAMETWVNNQKGKKLYLVLIRHELNSAVSFLAYELTKMSANLSAYGSF